jgi:hypothetical protein
MKIKELISNLNKIYNEYGNIDVILSKKSPHTWDYLNLKTLDLGCFTNVDGDEGHLFFYDIDEYEDYYDDSSFVINAVLINHE